MRAAGGTMIDSIIGGERSSPRVGKRVPSEMVIAGRNVASVDAVGAYLMGFNPRAIPHTRIAWVYTYKTPVHLIRGRFSGLPAASGSSGVLNVPRG